MSRSVCWNLDTLCFPPLHQDQGLWGVDRALDLSGQRRCIIGTVHILLQGYSPVEMVHYPELECWENVEKGAMGSDLIKEEGDKVKRVA